ncbi:tyrosine-type recombinase/integrase [Paenibacillus radicis (ex Xue et al. 2023)]|uniref:Site-specific integrase n=1 Tax=Paenibacillus radicis (ex Xue et al. 2023) TaxID=2972489 RepID=A0ABT1YJS6_9BACL|nr:site-specific integrase [Paenibacillus radicis (ex Xue et al. 2023)]MCR8633439.1 site-specific integrase [Paenibacillus radicis (ex Xue et al. 2023)]
MASIEPRGKNTWRLTVEVGYGPNQKRLRERDTVEVTDPKILKSPKKLQDYLDEELLKFKIKVEAGNYISPEKMRFSDFVEEWRQKYASDPNNLSPSTLNTYEDHIRSRLIPMFGHMRIDQISAMHIVTFLKELEKPGSRLDGRNDPLDSGTIGYIYRVLKNILTRAVEWKLISKNPMEKIKKPAPKDAKKKMLEQRANPQYYDEKEAQLVVDALYKESRKWRLLILGSMIGGCRRGELLGLELINVNFEDYTITVENNIPLSKKGVAIEKGPKSLASYRVIDMPEWYMEELEAYFREWDLERKHLGSKWLGGKREYLFHNGTGKPYYYQHPSKWWLRFCKRHELRYIKFHGLRHSSGTLLLEDEDEAYFDSILIAIQRRLGHSRLSTTSDTYVHVTKKVKKRTAGKFDKFAR